MLVASTDGVGTKLEVARATGRYDTVGIDLVAMCVDDLVCVGAEPLFLLDYIATGKVDPDRVATVVAGVHEGCRQAGCALIGGETAEHPGVMAPDDLDLAGFAVGVVEDGTQLGPERVRAGRRGGRAWPRPGCAPTATRWPATCCSSGPALDLDDPAWEGAAAHGGRRAAAAVGRSTRPAVLAVRGARSATALHACAHITGGGIVGNLPRALPGGLGAVLDRVALGEPRVFAEIQRLGAVEEAEMDRVFNRGVGMALVVDPAGARRAALGGAGRGRGRPSRVIGEVVAGGPGVRFA